MPNKDWCYTGVSIEIIKRLQQRLKFEYEFVESPDGKFGSEINGVWNGLINQVYLKVLILLVTFQSHIHTGVKPVIKFIVDNVNE